MSVNTETNSTETNSTETNRTVPIDQSDEAAIGDAPVDAASLDGEPEAADGDGSERSGRRIPWSKVVAFGVLPALVLLVALGAGYAKWRVASVRGAELAGIAATRAAQEGTVALLTYKPDTVETDLTAARDRLTGAFRDSYTSLTDQVVIPGAQQKLITAAARVPGAALVSATDTHAIVLVFVDQTTTIDKDAPSDTASSVRVTLDEVGGKWLISGFDPV